jgi:hypothetical protein
MQREGTEVCRRMAAVPAQSGFVRLECGDGANAGWYQGSMRRDHLEREAHRATAGSDGHSRAAGATRAPGRTALKHGALKHGTLKHGAVGLIACAIGGLACASDASSDGNDVPEFTQPTTTPTSMVPGAATGGPGSPTGAGSSIAGAAPPVAPAGSSSDAMEGNVTPAGIAPPAAGGSAAVGAGTGMAAAGASMGGSAALGESSGVAGATMAVAGTGNAGPRDTAGAGGGAGMPPAPVDTPELAPSCPAAALFCDDFEDDAAGQFPGAPWQNNTASGATVRVDAVQAFSGTQAVHVNAPPNQAFRRGYFSLEQGSSDIFPAVSRQMFGRAMMWLDATPNAVVHWTIIQAEGRAAAGTHDAYYRYGGQQQGGSGIMANYETNSGVSTDCYSHSATRMPVQRWACVEWHFDVGRNEMQLWLDGTELTDMHVVDRPTTPGSGCLGNAVGGEWLAPPAFTTLHLGWENYQNSTNDRNLWVDDVAIGTERMGCPVP